jgi:hypothetical protein
MLSEAKHPAAVQPIFLLSYFLICPFHPYMPYMVKKLLNQNRTKVFFSQSRKRRSLKNHDVIFSPDTI